MDTELTFGYMVIAWVTCAATFVILLGKLNEYERRKELTRSNVAFMLVLYALITVLFGMLWPLYHVISMIAQAWKAGEKIEKGEGK